MHTSLMMYSIVKSDQKCEARDVDGEEPVELDAWAVALELGHLFSLFVINRDPL